MVLLAVGSVLAGFLLVVAFPLESWLTPVFGEPEAAEHVVAPLVVSILVTVVMALGVLTAWLFVGRREVPVTAPVRVSPVIRAARRALYADTVNESLFMRPGQWLTRALVFFDNRGVDGAVNGMAAALGGSSSRLGRAQTGFVRTYALGMLGGAVIVAGALLAVTAGLPKGRDELARQIALALSLVVLLLAMLATIAYEVGGDRFQLTSSFAWIP